MSDVQILRYAIKSSARGSTKASRRGVGSSRCVATAHPTHTRLGGGTVPEKKECNTTAAR